MQRPRLLLATLALVGTALVGLTAVGASAADRGILVRDRDRLAATIEAEDEDAYDFDLSEGGSLLVGVSAARDSSLRPSLRLFQPDGVEFDLAPITRHAGTATPRVRRIAVPAGQTGRWQLRVAGTDGTTGGYDFTARISAPESVRERRLVLAPGQPIEVPFTGDTNALVKCSIRAVKRKGSLPANVRLLDPDGLEVPDSAGSFRMRRTVTAKNLALGQGFGRYALALDPAEGDTKLDVRIGVRFEKFKPRREALLPEAHISSIEPPQVRQEDSALTLVVQGTGLLKGSTARVDGPGVTVRSFDVADDGLTGSVVVDVAPDALYGQRRLVVFPPELLAESFSINDAVAVLAPNPTVTAVSLGLGEQGEQGIVLEATGTGFRDGGAVGISGTGITVGTTQVLSATSAQVTLSIAVNAPVGPRDVNFTQPIEGGGAAGTLKNAFDVSLPGPTFTSMTPSVLQPADARILVRVLGGNFNQGTTTTFSGGGLTVHSSTFVSTTTLDVTVSVAADAAPGPRNLTITPAAGGGPAHRFANKLVIAAAEPVVNSFSHATLAQGTSALNVTVSGRNFRPGDVLTASGSGVTFSGAATIGTTQITAIATVAGSASSGLRSLTVTHASNDGSRSGTLTNALRVTGSVPTVTSVSPSSIGVTGSGGLTRDVPLTITGTNFASGATVSFSRNGASGLIVVPGSTVIVSDTRIEVMASLSGTAGTGLWNVLVTNPSALGNSGVTGNNALEVKPSTTLAVNRVIAASGGPYGGERVTVQGSGFVDGCSVDFGSVRASGTQVIDASTLVTTVPAPTLASNSGPISADIKVTVPAGGSVTLTRGYSYATDDVRFRTISTVPAQGATSVSRNLKSAVVVLSAPADTNSGAYGSLEGLNTYWYESAGGFTAAGFRGFGPGGRFLVFSRTTLVSNLDIVGTGVYVLDIPKALKSLGGNAFAPTRLASDSNHDQQTFSVSLSVTDTTAPTLSTISPANGSTAQETTSKVVLSFSEEVDPLTVSLTSITLKQGTTTVPASIALSDDLKTVTITPQNELAVNTTYTVTVTSAVTDLCGNAIVTTSRTFTTGSGTDTTRPTIDSVVVESLPANLDGSGTYVSSAGVAGQPFDVYLPRSGWLLSVRFSDVGGSGVDEATFSAKCSVAVGSNAANAELASNFSTSSGAASWRIPANSPVTAGENVTFTFLVKDKAGNTATSSVITVDVVDKDASATNGGDHDPMDARRTWVLRADLDAFTASYASRSSPSSQQGATTSLAPNGLPDFDEALRLVGLGSGNMTPAAAVTVNGLDLGTNAIVRRLVLERTRELLNERFGIATDGSHGVNSVDLEFLLPGEQGSLSGMPNYSTANSANSSNAFSEISLGGTFGAESNAYTSSSKIGDAWYDARNLHEEADINTGGANDTGIYLLGALKLQVSTNSLFLAKVSSKLVTIHGGTPVGQDASDDDVLAGSFDRTSSTSTTLNARYDAIMDGIESIALYASAITAHEIGHALGLVPDGGPKTGLFGAAHYNNTFTEATSGSPNTSRHLDYLGNDLMGGSSTFDATALTGSDFKRFSPMDIAYLLNRLLYDEGK